MPKAKHALAQPDAELFAAIAIHKAGSDAQIALGNIAGADPGWLIADHIAKKHAAHWHCIMHKPAATLAGLKAKAQLAVENDNDTLAMVVARELALAADVAALG